MKTNLLEFLNQDKLYNLETEGQYGIPIIKPVYEIPNIEHYNWIGFNEVLSCKKPYNSMVHFMVHDYQFERVWNSLDKYTNVLKKHPLIVTPDFSSFVDSPKALQIWQCYRANAVGAYWQSKGLTVIPKVGWCDESTYDFVFDGLPKDSIVCISTLGFLNNRQYTEWFKNGYEEMKKRLTPKEILCYGRIPEWLKDEVTEMGCRVTRFDSFNQVKGISDEEYYKLLGV